MLSFTSLTASLAQGNGPSLSSILILILGLLVAMVVLVRVALPPLGRDLDLSREPVLGFPDGPRGRFDR